jgi:hypothetical protein
MTGPGCSAARLAATLEGLTDFLVVARARFRR